MTLIQGRTFLENKPKGSPESLLSDRQSCCIVVAYIHKIGKEDDNALG